MATEIKPFGPVRRVTWGRGLTHKHDQLICIGRFYDLTYLECKNIHEHIEKIVNTFECNHKELVQLLRQIDNLLLCIDLEYTFYFNIKQILKAPIFWATCLLQLHLIKLKYRKPKTLLGYLPPLPIGYISVYLDNIKNIIWGYYVDFTRH